MRMRQYLIISACLALSLAGCGMLPAAGAADSNVQPNATPAVLGITATLAATPVAGDVTLQPAPGNFDPQAVILGDNGKTFPFKVGDRFVLTLGELYNWDITVSDPAVLSRVVNITVIKGAQGVYEAHQTGTTELTANGDPLCRAFKPVCGMPSILFKITINVVS